MLTEDEMDQIADKVASRMGGGFTEEERESFHTLHKYVNSKHYPLLGKLLKVADESEYTVLKWGAKVILGVVFIGFVLLVSSKM